MDSRKKSFGTKKILEGIGELIDHKINKIIDNKNISKVNILTFDEVINYYYSMKKEIEAIDKCVLYIERIGGDFKFRVEQIFKDSSGEILYDEESEKDLYGRIVLTIKLDEELGKFIKGKDNVMVIL